jgi:hypothetical protein
MNAVNKKLTFVTGNQKKLEEFRAILGGDQFLVESHALDCKETQGHGSGLINKI